MIAIAIGAFFLRRRGYQMAPFVLGLVLGGLLDKSLRRGLVLADGSLEPFFTRPISLGFAHNTIFILLLYIPAFKAPIATIAETVSRQTQRLIPCPARSFRNPPMRIALCNEVLAPMSLEQQGELEARLGYDGLEIAPFTLSDTPDQISSAEAAQDLQDGRGQRPCRHRPALAGGQAHGLSLTAPDAAICARTIALMTRPTTLCAELGVRRWCTARRNNATSRWRHPLLPCARPRRSDAAAQAAADAGVIHCIEPLSRWETAVINTVAEAADLVQAINQPQLRTTSPQRRQPNRGRRHSGPDRPLATHGLDRAIQSPIRTGAAPARAKQSSPRSWQR